MAPILARTSSPQRRGVWHPPLDLQRTTNGEQERVAAIDTGIETDVDLEALSHEQLMVRVAQTRDRTAFKILFGHYAPRLKSHLMTLGLDAEKAEDLTQETLVTVWRKAALFDPKKARLSTWMFRVARNKFIDHTRRRKYPELDADKHLKDMAAPETTDTPVMERQSAAKVMKALETLKPTQREVIQLSFYEELSHSQIAERLDLPLGTVKSRIRIAFGALRKELGEMA